MIKTLRITSVLAVVGAAILTHYFDIPMLVGAGGDERVEKARGGPTVVGQFRQMEGARANSKSTGPSPLVEQAIAFAGHLPPKMEVPPPGETGPKPPPRPVVGPTWLKCKVFATMYFAGTPSLSQALIDEPGRGRHWVKQGSMVGHLRIEQVKDGIVVVKNSKDDTYEIPVETSSRVVPSTS